MERVGATPTAPPGPLATTGRAPALQAGGYGFESRMVHSCSRKRCSYLAARCPPGLPGFTGRINHTVSPPCGAGWREAHLAELADALDLGSSAFGRVGSTPTMRTVVTDDHPSQVV